MLYFANDYGYGAHPRLLQRLIKENIVPTPGYTNDQYCAAATEKIRCLCNCPQAEVFYLTGGTQTNAVVLDAILAPFQGVIAADSGHISTHEAGAIEATGHKILTVAHQQGKISADAVRRLLNDFYEDQNHSHMVFPGVIYISHPTEYGTLYSKEELKALSVLARQYRLPLFLDGARLAYGLAAGELTWVDIAELTDVFYIGGTKCGALCGEAVVFTRPSVLPDHMLTRIKRRGALPAKGRLLGIQFDELLADGLYEEIGRHALGLAEKLRSALVERGYRLLLDSPTNQIFVILRDEVYQQLSQQVTASFWGKYDSAHTVVRFVTDWATTEESVAALIELLTVLR